MMHILVSAISWRLLANSLFLAEDVQRTLWRMMSYNGGCSSDIVYVSMEARVKGMCPSATGGVRQEPR